MSIIEVNFLRSKFSLKSDDVELAKNLCLALDEKAKVIMDAHANGISDFKALFLVAAVASGLFGPKEVIAVIKNATYYWRQARQWAHEYINYLYKELSIQANVKGNILTSIPGQMFCN